MPSYRIEIAYDGSAYAGWAAQPGERSVQSEVEGAISRILSGTPLALTVAGRTDAGVHARRQVASFEIGQHPPDRFAARINAVLPRDISVLACEPAADGFDARRWATSRSYRYRVLADQRRDPFEEGRALWWPYPLDRSCLDACASALSGEHDFTAFTPTQTAHVRFVRAVTEARWVEESKSVLAFAITADAFMRHMVRVLVGTMLEVGAGKRTAEDFTRLLGGAPREAAGETAPPHGLYLEGVTFGDGPAFEHLH